MIDALIGGRIYGNGGEPRLALDLLAHAVLTHYHVSREREGVNARGAGLPA